MSKKAVIYVRVSTDEQAEFGYSLPSQIEACQEYAERAGFDVLEVVQDDVTGSTLDRRGLDQVRGMVRNGRVKALVVYTPDRLTRKLAHSLLLRDELSKAGVQLHYCNKGHVENTDEAQMMENIEAVFADYWRAKIIEGSRRGRRKKAANGRWPCDGHAAYGYRKEGKGREARLVINHEEAAIVRRIFRHYVGADGKPMTLGGIAALLTAEKVPPPNRGWAAKRGGENASKTWRKTTVSNILQRESYIGKLTYGGQKIQAPELQIITDDMFQNAQKRRRQGAGRARSKRKYDYLLAGHVLCSCGKRMSGFPMQKGRYLYYACSSRLQGSHIDHCGELHVRANGPEGADGAVWDWLNGFLDEKNLVIGLKTARREKERESAPRREELARVEKLLADKRGKLQEVTDNYMGETITAVSNALYERMRGLGVEIEALEIEEERLRGELNRYELTPEEEGEVRKLAREIREMFEEPSFELKRKILHVLDVQVKLAYDESGERGLEAACYLTLGQTPNRIPLPKKSVWQKSSSTMMT